MSFHYLSQFPPSLCKTVEDAKPITARTNRKGRRRKGGREAWASFCVPFSITSATLFLTSWLDLICKHLQHITLRHEEALAQIHRSSNSKRDFCAHPHPTLNLKNKKWKANHEKLFSNDEFFPFALRFRPRTVFMAVSNEKLIRSMLFASFSALPVWARFFLFARVKLSGMFIMACHFHIYLFSAEIRKFLLLFRPAKKLRCEMKKVCSSGADSFWRWHFNSHSGELSEWERDHKFQFSWQSKEGLDGQRGFDGTRNNKNVSSSLRHRPQITYTSCKP